MPSEIVRMWILLIASRPKSPDFGGSGYIINSEVSFHSCDFIGNTSTLEYDEAGGALCVEGFSTVVEMELCNFTSNSSYRSGLAIDILGGSVSMTNCDFSKNTGLSDSSAINLRSAELMMDSCKVANNTWGIRFQSIIGLTLSNCEVANNLYQGEPYDLSNGSEKITVTRSATSPHGSCCVTSGCTTNTESSCTELGGTWTEGGSCDDCEPSSNDCPADVDGDGSIGFPDLLEIISFGALAPAKHLLFSQRD